MNGNHRTFIAQIAGVARMAVRVVGIHREWVEERQAEYGDRNALRGTERGLAQLLND